MLKSDLEKWLLTVALNCLISFRCHLAAHLLQKSSLKKWGPGSSGWSTVIRVNSFNVPNPKSLVSEVVYTPKKNQRMSSTWNPGVRRWGSFFGKAKMPGATVDMSVSGDGFCKRNLPFLLGPLATMGQGFQSLDISWRPRIFFQHSFISNHLLLRLVATRFGT